MRRSIHCVMFIVGPPFCWVYYRGWGGGFQGFLVLSAMIIGICIIVVTNGAVEFNMKNAPWGGRIGVLMFLPKAVLAWLIASLLLIVIGL